MKKTTIELAQDLFNALEEEELNSPYLTKTVIINGMEFAPSQLAQIIGIALNQSTTDRDPSRLYYMDGLIYGIDSDGNIHLEW